jgi:hypothetical protein
MTKSMKTLVLSAAISGLLGGASATTINPSQPSPEKSVGAANVKLAKASFADTDKHSCKGKNDCKGQGGCKSGDNGCKGKNSCKGKGGCNTEGSKKMLV